MRKTLPAVNKLDLEKKMVGIIWLWEYDEIVYSVQKLYGNRFCEMNDDMKTEDQTGLCNMWREIYSDRR